VRGTLEAIDHAAVERLLQELVAARSENPPGDEAAVIAVLERWLSAAGIPCETTEVLPRRPNLSCVLGDGPGPVLLLNAHTDTMPAGPGWTGDPFAATVAGERLYGRGACDTKGGLAAMAGAMLAVHVSGRRLRGRVVLDAVIDEEAGAAGTRATLGRGRTADWAIVSEPTEMQVVRVGTGQVDLEILVAGTAAHGSEPDRGRNAISDAAALVAAIEEDNARPGPEHPLIGKASWSVGTIEGGVQTSIVPPSCRLTADRRVLPGQPVTSAEADLERIVDAVRGRRPGLAAEFRSFVEIPPFETSESSPVARSLLAAANAVGHSLEGYAGMRATSDAVWLVQAGIPTVVFGPGSIAESAHRPDEFVPLAEVRAATEALALAIVDLVG
jgi:acetylornithine deacetylase